MQKQLQGLLSIDSNFIVKGIKVQGAENIIHLKWKRKQQICPECGRKVTSLYLCKQVCLVNACLLKIYSEPHQSLTLRPMTQELNNWHCRTDFVFG